MRCWFIALCRDFKCVFVNHLPGGTGTEPCEGLGAEWDHRNMLGAATGSLGENKSKNKF